MKKIFRCAIFAGFVILANIMPSIAKAGSCSSSIYSVSLAGPPSLVIDPMSKEGTVVWSNTYDINAFSGGPCSVSGYSVMSTIEGGTIFLGLSYRVTVSNSSLCNGTFGPSTQMVCNIPITNPPPTHKIKVELVRTGATLSSGSLSGSFAIWIAYPNENKSGGWGYLSYRWSSSTTIQVAKKPTCSVTTSSINVDLGKTIPLKTFSGIGSVSASKPFNIALQCQGGTENLSTAYSVTLMDQGQNTNTSDTLTLTKNSAAASGIGIQILNGTTAVKYGSQWQGGTTGNGTINIPLAARYIQTNAVVTPGVANGMATFTMSYQ